MIPHTFKSFHLMAITAVAEESPYAFVKFHRKLSTESFNRKLFGRAFYDGSSSSIAPG